MTILRRFGAGLRLVGSTLEVWLAGKKIRADAPVPTSGQGLMFDATQDSWQPGPLSLPASLLDLLKQQHFSPGAIGAGNFTVGTKFRPSRAGMQCKGIRFFWNDGAAPTVRVRLWKGGVSLATATVAVAGVGFYTANFAAIDVQPHIDYFAATYETTGTKFIGKDSVSMLPVAPLLLRDVLLRDWGIYVAGDAEPSTSDPGFGYYVEPLFV